MARRGTTIALSRTEKLLLDRVARADFGTTNIPYGEIVGALATDRLEEKRAEQGATE